MTRRLSTRLPVLAIAGLLGACAAQPSTRSGMPTTVEERAVQRWQHLIDGRADLAWNYLTPGVRSAKPQAKYAEEMSDRPVKWTKVAFRDKECESDDVCTVRIDLEYRVMMPVVRVGEMTVPAMLNERWLRIGGQWFHLPADFDEGGLR